MLPKHRRLSRRHYSLVNTLKNCQPTPHLSMRVVSLVGEKKTDRYSFVVSNKVSKTAVERNRLRRCGYGSINELVGETANGKGLMFFYRKGSSGLAYKDIKKEISLLLNQTQLITYDKKISHKDT